MIPVPPFRFDQKVADCFDDMVTRSIPHYQDLHHILLELVRYQVRPHDCIYDLGCATGTTLKLLANALADRPVQLIGIDQSAAMIAQAQKKCLPCPHPLQLLCQDLQHHQWQTSGLVIMNYTLQFIPRSERTDLLKKIYQSLRPGGLLVLTEKIESTSAGIQSLQNELYQNFKRSRGYSELEIAQKRRALEDVLVPLAPAAQLSLLQASGFEHADMVFRWFNFACFIGLKTP